MERQILFCWVGTTDLKAAAGEPWAGTGPVAQAVAKRPYVEIVLLNNWDTTVLANYVEWLQELTTSPVTLRNIHLTGPTNFGEIYQAASGVISEKIQEHGPNVDLVFHLSPGTPAMAAVWILLAKTRFPAELIESSKAHGVRTASVPFDISADFVPELLRKCLKRKKGYLRRCVKCEPGVSNSTAFRRPSPCLENGISTTSPNMKIRWSGLSSGTWRRLRPCRKTGPRPEMWRRTY